MSHEDFMAAAAQLGLDSVRNNWGGPFGAVIVKDGEIIAAGQNRVLLTADVTAHAEIEAIRKAATVLNPHAPSVSPPDWSRSTLALVDRDEGSDDPVPRRSRMLQGYQIYSNGFPCPMCMGAIYWARLDALFYACGVEETRAIGFDDAFQYEDFTKPLTERRIPITQVGLEHGLSAYRAWSDLPQPHPY